MQTSTVQARAAGLLVCEATRVDADDAGRIFYEAFESIASRHHLPVEPSSPEFTRFKARQMLSSEGFLGLIAERAGRVLGCAFVDERSAIAGVGPVAVDPEAQDDGIGRALVDAALQHLHQRDVVGVRLVQTAYHYRSLALYCKLGLWSASRFRCFKASRRP